MRTSLRAVVAAGLVMALASPVSIGAQGPSRLAVPYTEFTLRQRPARHPASRRQRADRDRQRLVPRRLGQREARAHRLRAPVRAPDVRRVEARAGGLVRHLARRRRRQQQRLHHRRPHQLLHRRAVERARADALPRVRPHGLPARHDDARARRRPARRGQERAAPEHREPALRHPRARARQHALSPGTSLQLVDDRLDGRPDRGQP